MRWSGSVSSGRARLMALASESISFAIATSLESTGKPDDVIIHREGEWHSPEFQKSIRAFGGTWMSLRVSGLLRHQIFQRVLGDHAHQSALVRGNDHGRDVLFPHAFQQALGGLAR